MRHSVLLFILVSYSSSPCHATDLNFVNSKHSPGDSFLEELAIAKTAEYFLTTSEIN